MVTDRRFAVVIYHNQVIDWTSVHSSRLRASLLDAREREREKRERESATSSAVVRVGAKNCRV